MQFSQQASAFLRSASVFVNSRFELQGCLPIMEKEFSKPQSYLLLITANVTLNLHLFKNNEIANILWAKIMYFYVNLLGLLHNVFLLPARWKRNANVFCVLLF